MHSVVVDTKHCSHAEQALLCSKSEYGSSVTYNSVAITYVHEVVLGIVVIIRVPETSATHPVSRGCGIYFLISIGMWYQNLTLPVHSVNLLDTLSSKFSYDYLHNKLVAIQLKF